MKSGEILFPSFHMGNIATGLDGKDKIFRHCSSPGVQGFGSGQLIKRIVDLYNPEMPGVKVEHLLGRYTFRIKRTFPVSVMPARSAAIPGHLTQTGGL